MNSTEAKEMAEFGMWTKISSSIKDLINDACNDGEFEINIPMIFEEFLRWWLLELNNIVKPMSEPTMPSGKIYYFDFKDGDKHK